MLVVRNSLLGLLIAFAVLSPPDHAEAKKTLHNCKVKKVIDGDTVNVRCGKRTHKIRLVAVDTPESENRGGKRRFEKLQQRGMLPPNWEKTWELHREQGLWCKQVTTDFLEGQRLSVTVFGTDQSGRKIADIVRESDQESLVKHLYHDPSVLFYEGNRQAYVREYRKHFLMIRAKANGTTAIVKRILSSNTYLAKTDAGDYVRVRLAGTALGEQGSGRELGAVESMTEQIGNKRIMICLKSQCLPIAPGTEVQDALVLLDDGRLANEVYLEKGWGQFDPESGEALFEARWLRRAHKEARRRQKEREIALRRQAKREELRRKKREIALRRQARREERRRKREARRRERRMARESGYDSGYRGYSGSSGGRVHVKGYYRKDGTHVRSHTRSAPRSFKMPKGF